MQKHYECGLKRNAFAVLVRASQSFLEKMFKNSLVDFAAALYMGEKLSKLLKTKEGENRSSPPVTGFASFCNTKKDTFCRTDFCAKMPTKIIR